MVEEQLSGFNSLVLANHDPAFAARTVQQLQSTAGEDCEMGQPGVAAAISGFVGQLQQLQRTKTSCYSLMVGFDAPLSSVGFDAASFRESAELTFLSRDTSKPGRCV